MADVQRNVAMEWPDARVVLHPLHHQVRRICGEARRHDDCVTARRILGVDHDCTIPLPETLSQDPVIVAVEMHRVNNGGVVV